MSRPRKPFGAQHPGRLPATMMKVLAAEMSDPGRLRRGKKYATDDSVLDIIIEPGLVTCEIQGTRSTPYIAKIGVTQGSGMPLRRDITKQCTCPDDDNWDDYACKHVVATMFTLSNEFLVEPELLDLWRDHDAGDDSNDDSDQIIDATEPGRRHLSLVRSEPAGAADETAQRSRSGPTEDPLREILKFPDGSDLPDIPRFDSLETVQPKTRELASILRDAHGNLRIEWD